MRLKVFFLFRRERREKIWQKFGGHLERKENKYEKLSLPNSDLNHPWIKQFEENSHKGLIIYYHHTNFQYQWRFYPF